MECPDCGALLWMHNFLEKCDCGYEKAYGRIRRRGKSVEVKVQVMPLPSAAPAVGGKAKPETGNRPGRRRSGHNRLIQDRMHLYPGLRDLELCRKLDEDGVELPKSMRTAERSFEAAYRNPKLKKRLQSKFSKIRRAIREGKAL